MRVDTVVMFVFLVRVSADTNLPLRVLAAVAQCEATCLTDKEEWYNRHGPSERIHEPQCLEEISAPVERVTCEEVCTGSTPCLESCKCVRSILISNYTGIPRSAVIAHRLTQPELFCRETDILSFKWAAPEGLHPVFITEYREGGSSTWKIYSKTKDKRELLSRLSSNTKYKIRVRAFVRDGQLGTAVTSSWTSTLNDSFVPRSVADITVSNTTLVNRSLNVIVSWTPSWDRTCFYELVFWNRKLDSVPVPIHLSEKLHFELKNLELGKRYYLAVRATNRNHMRESAKKELHFTTPSCLDMMDDPADCPPPVPWGLVAREEESASPGLYNIEVKWNSTGYLPGYSLVSLTSIIPSPEEEGGFALLSNVTGDTTQTVFPGVPLVYKYQISVVSVSNKGHQSEAAVGKYELIAIPDSHRSKQSAEYSRNILAIVTSLSLVVAIVVGITCHCHNKHQTLRCQQEVQGKKEIPFVHNKIINKEQVTNDYYDAIWEIPEESVLLGEVLGSGAFGIVRKGILQKKDGSWIDVAIKTLPNDHTAEDYRHFWQEINMMKNVGCHPHIVSLVGCCTRGSDLQLVVEFCALGDLQDYLRKEWAEMSGADDYFKPEPKLKYAELSLETLGGEYAGSYSASLGYCKQREKLRRKLTSIDLLSLARQIAIGMEYLASCRVVHRDLAARNVLLTKECTAKISDFGLSRDIYQENVYRKKGKGLVPVKWMAFESLLHQIYTTQSDVWSFGILLWEIVTLGGNPYPGISVNKLFNFLKQGHRMERPSNCSEELYDIMSACWRLKPADRPTFTELHQRLDALLESSSPQKYLNLNLMMDANNSESYINYCKKEERFAGH